MFKKKDKYDAGTGLLLHIRGQAVRYVSVRRGDNPVETVVGKDGVINLSNDRVVIMCENGAVLDRPLAGMKVGELMSRDGATFTFDDEEGVRTTVVAYYTYYRK